MAVNKFMNLKFRFADTIVLQKFSSRATVALNFRNVGTSSKFLVNFSSGSIRALPGSLKKLGILIWKSWVNFGRKKWTSQKKVEIKFWKSSCFS
jgi:hypothetical protein